jgi:hypothetical protein
MQVCRLPTAFDNYLEKGRSQPPGKRGGAFVARRISLARIALAIALACGQLADQA